ncbi:hypothetical protein K469DRAFT_764161, partial [Zopfia rhizophila CBS 207.26]
LCAEGSGLITHPTLSPYPSTLSAFHQLHCLDLLRLRCYNSLFEREIMEDHLQPTHLRHCFDYLRSSIICAADSIWNLWMKN